MVRIVLDSYGRARKAHPSARPGSGFARSPAYCLSVGVIGVACIMAGLNGSAAQPAQQPIPAALIAVWEKAGATFGWISVDAEGRLLFDQQKPPLASLPAFRFSLSPFGQLKLLPPPEAPFGLWLEQTELTDAGIKELHNLKR